MKDLTRYCVALTVTRRSRKYPQARETGPRNVHIWAKDPDDAIAGARQITRDMLLGELVQMSVDTCRVSEVC